MTDSLGVGFVSFGETVQEGKDLFRGDLVGGAITKFLDKPFDDSLISPYCVFF